MSERLGRPFVIENRTGAGSNIAAETVVKALPDGYTLLLAGSPNAINATLYDKLSFNFIRDTAPVVGIANALNLLLVNPSVPAKTVPELITYARANPGKLNMASIGIGSVPHMAGELFKMRAGVDLVHVPYRGAGEALTALIAGQVQVLFLSKLASMPHVLAGNLRLLAVTTGVHSDLLSGVPSVDKFLPGYEATTSWGISAPRNTPVEIVDLLNKEINAILTDATIRKHLNDEGASVLGGPAADFGKLIAEETEKWGEVVRAVNIKPE
jgi:tripartite-type tricarboxylate transporter receptor subunit TctC